MSKSKICPKCSGSGLVSFDHDGGICYKCEGQGFIGEMPANFTKTQKFPKEAIDISKQYLKDALRKRELDGQIAELKHFGISDGADAYTWMNSNNKSFRFGHSKFTAKYIGQTMQFGLVSDSFPLQAQVQFSNECISISVINKN